MPPNGTLDQVESLVSPFGVVSRVRHLRSLKGLDALDEFSALAGSGSSQHWNPPSHATAHLTRCGAGAIGDRAQARLVAIAEAAERYSCGDFLGEHVVWAVHADLDGAALDPASVPRCSTAELAHPRCGLSLFDPGEAIRWVRGTDLATGEATWIPAVMACYGLRDATAAEQFWFRISTGCAVHTDPRESLVRSMCEVIERDMIAITWLQRLPLPLVPDSCRTDTLNLLRDWSERHFVETYLFDATSDLGIPTVYCLQVAPYDENIRQSLGCSTGRDMASAAEKAMLEALRSRALGRKDHEPPDDFAAFAAVDDGARYMGRPKMAAEFAFLIDGAPERRAPPRPPLPAASAEALAVLIDAVSQAGMQAIAVDRTPRELADVGLTATCVVIPQLQPMTLTPLAQFRAHPRLYQAPSRMGYRSLPEEELNPWPQPFA